MESQRVAPRSSTRIIGFLGTTETLALPSAHRAACPLRVSVFASASRRESTGRQGTLLRLRRCSACARPASSRRSACRRNRRRPNAAPTPSAHPTVLVKSRNEKGRWRPRLLPRPPGSEDAGVVPDPRRRAPLPRGPPAHRRRRLRRRRAHLLALPDNPFPSASRSRWERHPTRDSMQTRSSQGRWATLLRPEEYPCRRAKTPLRSTAAPATPRRSGAGAVLEQGLGTRHRSVFFVRRRCRSLAVDS